MVRGRQPPRAATWAEARPARLSLEQYQRMLEAGVLADGDPVELIDGVLVLKDRAARGDDPMTHGTRHALAVRRLTALQGRVGADCFLQVQLPVALPPRSAPEPDAAIVRGRPDDYAARHPGPAEAAVVFEVADHSRRFDRGVKQRLYASAGVPVYLIVDLTTDVVEVHRGPSETGYTSRSEHRRGETIALPTGTSELGMAVGDLLPPAAPQAREPRGT